MEGLLTSAFGQGDVDLCDGGLLVSVVTVDDVQKLTRHGWSCLSIELLRTLECVVDEADRPLGGRA